jgi:hypothetical protein
MKKSILLITALVAARAAFAQETAVSTNQFGLLRVDSTLTNTIVAVPWLDLSGNSSPSAVSVADIVKTANLTVGDKLSAYKPDGTYDSWELKSTGWDPVTTVTTGGSSTAPAADGRTVALGSAFWLYRQNPTSEGVAVPFYIYGQVPASAVTTTISAPDATTPVWNLVANARNAAVALNSLTVSSGSINAADEIYIVADGNPTMYTYKAGQGWGCITRVTVNGRPVNRWAVSDVTIPKGTGFWYVSKGGNPTFTW